MDAFARTSYAYVIVSKLSPGPVREGAFFEKHSADFREFTKIHENSRFFEFGGLTPLFDRHDKISIILLIGGYPPIITYGRVLFTM